MKNTCYLAAILIILLTACGPSESEIATMTASAWTATPAPSDTPIPTPTVTPSPTATPIPYDLTVRIQDTEGNPIPWAEVNLIELEDMQSPDEAGEVAWLDLPGETVNLAVTAQGFFSHEVAEILERGPNEVVITLERDPFGLLSAEACLPSESLLYIEDFQDMLAQGWDAIEDAVALNVPGWSIFDIGEGNWVLSATEEAGGATLGANKFDNAVWRLRFMFLGGANPNFEWRVVEDASYQVGIITADIGGGAMQRAQGGSMVQVGSWNFHPFENEWYFLEISYFDGLLNVWVNGKSIMTPYQDPQPWDAGTIRITPFMNPGSQIVLDNFVVCGLSQPFETGYVEPQE